jgi:hypothetical protein
VAFGKLPNMNARKFQNDFMASHEDCCVMLSSFVNAISKHKIKLYVGSNANVGKNMSFKALKAWICQPHNLIRQECG